MTAYYNEHDAQKAAWLRELIKAGLIAPGEVDERSIEDVIPAELTGYAQCHFFAGIGVWSYSLRCAGWPDDRPVWTGSCPCQPFSAAGKRGGTADERHLWPAFYHLISVNRPDVVFGEQVASKDGFAWLDVVQADLEAAAYAVGALSLPACGFGAPHKRERLFFVANSTSEGSLSEPFRRIHRQAQGKRTWNGESQRSRDDGSLGNAENNGCEQRILGSQTKQEAAPFGCRKDEGSRRHGQSNDSAIDGVAQGHTVGERLEIGSLPDGRRGPVRIKGPTAAETGIVNGVWRNAELILCNDPEGWKWRGVEPGSFPLAHGAAARVLRLRGYGDGIVAPVAQAFIEAYMAEREIA